LGPWGSVGKRLIERSNPTSKEDLSDGGRDGLGEVVAEGHLTLPHGKSAEGNEPRHWGGKARVIAYKRNPIFVPQDWGTNEGKGNISSEALLASKA